MQITLNGLSYSRYTLYTIVVERGYIHKYYCADKNKLKITINTIYVQQQITHIIRYA